MTWFKREKKPIENPTPVEERRVRTEGMWTKCSSCRAIIWKKDLETNWEVCPKCDHHFRLGSRRRLEMLLDDEVYTEFDADLASSDPLHFTDTRPYAQRLKEAQHKLGMKDAILTAEGRLNGRPVICCSMEFGFIGGSMGAVVGEKVARAVERALAQRQPLIVVSSSGGARMMEGVVSLMQLAKVSAALGRLDEAKLPFISDPHRSHHRRRYRQLRHARRFEYCRAGRADRLRRTARDRTNHPPEIARRFPDR